MKNVYRILLCLCLLIEYSSLFGQQKIYIKTSSDKFWNKIDFTTLNFKILDNSIGNSIKNDSLIEIKIISPKTNSRLNIEIAESSFSLNIDTLDMTITIMQRLRKESNIFCTINFVNSIYEEWDLKISQFNSSELDSDKQYFINCYETKTGTMPAYWRP